jgi:hypothetical protein
VRSLKDVKKVKYFIFVPHDLQTKKERKIAPAQQRY